MSVHAQTIIQWLEQFAPKKLAMEGDPIGLQVGTLNKTVNRVLIALEATPEVVAEAIQQQADLLICHHPLLFRPVQQIRTDLPQGEVIASLLKHDISLYAAHTNLDIAVGGVNDWLCERIGIQEIEVLVETSSEQLKKLVVFVPREQEGALRQALGNAGAGHIGEYSHCTFRTEGIGTFLPGAGTNPHIGQEGRLEQVEEVKIETIIPASLEKKVLRAVQQAHPYEEPACDIYPVLQRGETYGLGRIGKLNAPLTLAEFAKHVKHTLAVDHCRIVGSGDAHVQKIAVIGGKGAKYMSAALFKGADVLITGDVDYHTAQDALAAGMNMIDPGHYAEYVMIEGVRNVLEKAAQKHSAAVEIIASAVQADPFTMV